MNIKTIILAAGQGTRMRSEKPKVLHKIAGTTLLEHVANTSFRLPDNKVYVVYGHGADQVLEELAALPVSWIEQAQRLGTGHAVQQAIDHIHDEDHVLILYGDVPLLELATIEALLNEVGSKTMALLTVHLDDPRGYGRIIRDTSGKVIQIVEEKDASGTIKAIDEVNTGIMAVPGKPLKNWLTRLKNNNAQKEYYLTDIIAMAVHDGFAIATVGAQNPDEVLGVNDKIQLAHLERVYQRQQAQQLMQQGVTLYDPTRFDLRGRLEQAGSDIEIDANVILQGNIRLGNRVRIGANSIIRDSVIADDVEILPNCIIDQAYIGAGSRIGPFARLRPQTELAAQVHIGNFVEIKKTAVAAGSKINHLSYIGDARVGEQVNIGAGTITCNYDGANKYQTIIGNRAFIGSNAQLIAPVTIGENATIGAGSTISKEAPDNQLTLTRAKQISIAGWKRPKKQES